MVDTTHSKAGPFVILKTLGSGGFGVVKKAVHEKEKKMVAIKFLRPDVSKADVQGEVLTLKRLNHPNLANIVDFYEKMLYTKKDGRILEKMAIVMELAEKGCLFEYLKVSSVHYNRGFREHIARTHFLQLIEALQYCHKQGIAHRDIKPDNILLDANYNLKLADFGWASSSKRVLKTNAGTKSYQPPEIQEEKFYEGPPADLFSAGVVLFILLSGHPPFKTATATDPWYRHIRKGNLETFWSIHQKSKAGDKEKAAFYSEDFISIVNGLLQYDPEQRLKVTEILDHPWCKGPTATSEEIIKEFKNYSSLIESTLKKGEKAEGKTTIDTNVKFGQGTFQGYTLYRDPEAEKDLDKQVLELGIDMKIDCQRELFEFSEEDEYPASMIYSKISPNVLFKRVILIAAECMSTGLKVNDKKFKLKGNVVTQDESEWIQVTIAFYKYDAETTAICFTKTQGDKMKFLDFIEEKFARPLSSN